jgi:ketosteroid isomerase-like protein
LFRVVERLMGMNNAFTGAAPSARVQANLDFATEVLSSCFDPARPDEFARFCTDERGRFMFAAFADAFPDARFRVDWVVADERRVVLGGRIVATHEGDWRGVAPTGRPIDVATVSSFTVADGQAIDVAVSTDSLLIAEQIGAVEPFGPKACQLFESR